MKKILSILVLSFVLASCSQNNKPSETNNWSQEDIQKLTDEIEYNEITNGIEILSAFNADSPPVKEFIDCFKDKLMKHYSSYDVYIASKKDSAEAKYIENQVVVCALKYVGRFNKNP